MPLFKLKIIDERELDSLAQRGGEHRDYCMWTRPYHYLVRAADEMTAREMARRGEDREYPDDEKWWLDPTIVSCEQVNESGKDEIILVGNPTG